MHDMDVSCTIIDSLAVISLGSLGLGEARATRVLRVLG